MRYSNGTEVRRGDLVRIGGKRGVVVCSVDTDEYSAEFSREIWRDVLESGVLVDLEVVGLIQCIEPDEDLEFCARAEA